MNLAAMDASTNPANPRFKNEMTETCRLEELWPEKAKLVKLRYFAGLTILEASEALGVSHATAERHWTFARAWLYSQLRDDS